MKKTLAMLMLAAVTACSSDDDAVGKYTETWTVNIEPEFVLNGNFWGGYTSIWPVMEATDNAGNRTATYMMDEIKGFEFEEGYRYKLQIEAQDVLAPLEEQGIYWADASRYEFRLLKVLSKEYVGIREEGRRDVEMDVEWSRVRSKDEADSWQYALLVGTVVGTGETIYMAPFEIAGLNDSKGASEFVESDCDPIVKYRVRMKVSITPSDRPVYGSIQRRIRLQEIVSKEIMDDEGIIYMERDEVERLLFGI